MNTIRSFKMGRRALLAVAILAASAPGAAWAQASAKQFQGHWSVVEISTERDGAKVHTFGTNLTGLFIFDPSGRYTINIFRPDLPRFASNNRMTGTADENKAVVQGSLSHFGTYRVNEKDGSFTVTPTGSSFPNWTGIEQPQRKFEISGDTMSITNPAGSTGGVSLIVLKRIK